MPTFPAQHADIAYDVTGDGPPVVQLHGLTSSRARDAQLGVDLCRHVRGHRMIRYDARGHGRSTGRPQPRDYTWSALAADLQSLLDHESPGRRVHGVGQSMGAGTLLHAALANPDRFTSLVLGIPPTAWASRVRQQQTYRSRADMVEREGVGALLAMSGADSRPPAADPNAPITAPDVTGALLPALYRGAALADLPPPEQIADLDVPTLILAWVDDPDHPVSTSHRLQELISGSELVLARTPTDAKAWPGLTAEHIATHSSALEARELHDV
ncbi:alpha/beta hydrolase [soil metagenome]